MASHCTIRIPSWFVRIREFLLLHAVYADSFSLLLNDSRNWKFGKKQFKRETVYLGI